MNRAAICTLSFATVALSAAPLTAQQFGGPLAVSGDQILVSQGGLLQFPTAIAIDGAFLLVADAGANAAGRIGEVTSVQVIPRPHEDINDVLGLVKRTANK